METEILSSFNKQLWKRRRNKIYKIRDSEGRWREEEGEKSLGRYTHPTSSSSHLNDKRGNRQEFEQIMEGLPRQITETINDSHKGGHDSGGSTASESGGGGQGHRNRMTSWARSFNKTGISSV